MLKMLIKLAIVVGYILTKKIIMNRITLIIGVAITFLLMAGCKKDSDSASSTSSKGSIYGTITDFATGEPVRNANVQLRPGGETTLTGYDGMYEFLDVSDGDYSITVSKAEYTDLIDDYVISVRDGRRVKRDVQIQKKVVILEITDTNGHSIDVLEFGSEESVTSKAFNVFNNGTISIECHLTYSCEWISSVTSLPNAIYPGQTVNVTVIIDRSKLSSGENTTYLHIQSNNGSNDLKISAIGISLPSVHMQSVDGIGYDYATLNGKIIDTGLPQYTACGFVVGLSSNPTIEESLQTIQLSPSTTTFSKQINELQPNKKYYVRAYASNANGIAYSNELSFSTLTTVNPYITTMAPRKLYENGATLFALLQSTGTPSILKKGFVVAANNPNPTIENCDGGWIIPGTQVGLYNLGVSGMTLGTTYYVKAFAITKFDTIYYNSVSFEAVIPYKTIGSLSVRLEDEYEIESNLFQYNFSHYEAVHKCDDLTLGSYDDWRLPTADELKFMYEHRNEIGGFAQEEYWSSTKNIDEGNFQGSSAWNDGYVSINFSNGEVHYNNPMASTSKRARAVR